ncbi:TonB-dependent receptor domain-containing protein [Capnocytophaga sputigena]|uniref:TonB-dependent receptor n=1 Tax=Capnocytophaga sputigena TaxID=1019 RepID=UPI0028E7C38D|nr:TonB-dependent receptor [Capnocytophaga sputigena]
MKSWFLNVAILLLATITYAQSGTITGEVIDGEYNAPLMGANVLVKGTTHGVSTDMQGKYSLNVNAPTGTLEFSYLGYVTKTVPYKLVNGKAHVKVTLSTDQQSLGEVVVTAKSTLLDIAKERKTPVAVSTIQATEIVEKLGTRELPEVLNRTPSVYATKGGGGFGDSKINIRGFDTKNIAVMVNGMPVNDMEGGTVYWSNWSGLADVTSAMQVQRGLGASKLAIASVGGTINVVTRAADMSEGGTAYFSYGSSQEYKGLVAYNTGKSLTGWSASVLFSKNAGRKYVDGTKFDGYSYYFALGYEPSDKHSFQLMFTGAPQWHHQRSNSPLLSDYLRYGDGDEPNRKYNSDWGYLEGEEYTIKKNLYHKPVAMLNWDWKINESTSLSTVVYASLGRGMGTNSLGEAHSFSSKTVSGTTSYSLQKHYLNTLRTEEGLIDFDKAVQYNKGQAVSGLETMQHPGEAGRSVRVTDPSGKSPGSVNQGFIRNGSVNSHDWYGFLTNLQHQINDNFTANIGLDGRYYYGYHHQVVTDMLGNNSYVDNKNKNLNNPNVVTTVVPANVSWNPFQKTEPLENQIGYSNDGEVKWFGLFSQFEYSDDHFSAFIQGATSIQSYQRIDSFLKPGTLAITGKPETAMSTKTGFKDIVGYNIKGGINYNINEHHNVFANVGYYSKQPLFDAVYPNYRNFLNPSLTNEKIFGVELGYGFKSSFLNVNLNLYHTSWKDRYLRKSNNLKNNTIRAYANILGIEEIHQGIELEANAKINDYVKVNASLSLGDWYYKGDASGNLTNESNETIDDQGNVVPAGSASQVKLFLDKVKVGSTAQTTASLGLTILPPIKGLKFDVDWRYVDDLYANLNISNFNKKVEAEKGALKLPSYNLFDLGASYKWQLTDKQRLTFSVQAYNVLDTYYISESYTSIHTTNGSKTYQDIDVRNQVYFGDGRTFSFGIRYNF